MPKVTFVFEDINGNECDYDFRYEIDDELRKKYISCVARRPMLDDKGCPINSKTVPCSAAECLSIFTFFDIIDVVDVLDDRISVDQDFLDDEFKETAYEEFEDTDTYRAIRDSGIPDEKEFL